MLNEIDLSRADLNLLVLFEVVLTERHVGQTAERLNLSPSAVSHGLGRLRRLLNDPLFLRTPKGVVPTARALELADPIADLLARARRVISSAEPFDAATSTRQFTIGAPDGISAVLLPPLLAHTRRAAPGVDIRVRQILPRRSPTRPWETALADLDARAIDIAIIPLDEVPARFVEQVLYEEDFVIAARAGHPFADAPTLERYCEMQHLVVSHTGDADGYIDEVLAKLGLTRRVALTAPNFMLALALTAETDLIAALPERLVAMHAERFGLVRVVSPLPLRRFPIRAVTPKVAMMDAGLAWLFEMLGKTARVAITADTKARGTSRRRQKSPMRRTG